ncbi:MAG: hypothetical protein WAK17_25675 [Candidatus Nitrosopolaris sp.]|jgi:hypothetical protein
MVRHPEVGPGLLTVLSVTKVVVLLVILMVTMLAAGRNEVGKYLPTGGYQVVPDLQRIHMSIECQIVWAMILYMHQAV